MVIKQNLTHLFLKCCLTLFIGSIVILNFRPKRNENDKRERGRGGGKKERRQSGMMCKVTLHGPPWFDIDLSPDGRKQRPD